LGIKIQLKTNGGRGWFGDLTARALKQGLDVLGIETVEQMWAVS
jgi:hypothetical protein